MSFSALAEQPEARLLLTAAVKEGPAHAYLFHGPAGVGKRDAARTFAAELLGDERRVEAGMHPDLFSLEALGEMIRIDEIRALHRDLHMRPFEAERRVYVIADAHLLNDDAADALLKDLEEPPQYAVIVLVADELGPIPPTIRSRCQLVPFRRLSGRVIRELLAERAPGLSENEARALARVSGGRLDRVERLLDPAAKARREELLRVARAPYAEPELDPADAAALLLDGARAAGEAAKERAERELEGVELTSRELEQRLRRVQRGAEREELLASLEELASWYRDLVVVAAGAESAVVHADRLDLLRAEGTRERSPEAERGAELARAGVADVRGVQPEPEPRPGGAVRAAEARFRQRSLGLNEEYSRSANTPQKGLRGAGARQRMSQAFGRDAGCAVSPLPGGSRFGSCSVRWWPVVCRRSRSCSAGRGDRGPLRAPRGEDPRLLHPPARLARGGGGRRPDDVHERVPRTGSRRRARGRVGLAVQDRRERLPFPPPLFLAPRPDREPQ